MAPKQVCDKCYQLNPQCKCPKTPEQVSACIPGWTGLGNPKPIKCWECADTGWKPSRDEGGVEFRGVREPCPCKKTNAAKFEGGATRSHHAPRYELVPKAAIDRLTERLEFGATIHGDNNWREGGPEFVKQCKRHLMEHLLNYLAGDATDDHLAAVLCNAAFLAYFEDKAKHDKSPNPASGH